MDRALRFTQTVGKQKVKRKYRKRLSFSKTEISENLYGKERLGTVLSGGIALKRKCRTHHRSSTCFNNASKTAERANKTHSSRSWNRLAISALRVGKQISVIEAATARRITVSSEKSVLVKKAAVCRVRWRSHGTVKWTTNIQSIVERGNISAVFTCFASNLSEVWVEKREKNPENRKKKVKTSAERERKGKKMSIEVKVLLMLASIIASSSSTTVKSGAYHNIVIEVEKDVPVDDCSNFLLSLEVRFFDIALLDFHPNVNILPSNRKAQPRALWKPWEAIVESAIKKT